MESQVKCHSINVFEASQQNRIAAFAKTTEVEGDLFWNVEINSWKMT